jgi:hypothetical protein
MRLYKSNSINLNKNESESNFLERSKRRKRSKLLNFLKFNSFFWKIESWSMNFRRRNSSKWWIRKNIKTRHNTILIFLYENVERFLRFADIFISMIRTRFFSSEVFLRAYRRKIEKDIKKSLTLFSSFENNLLIFYKNISTRNICDCSKQMSD